MPNLDELAGYHSPQAGFGYRMYNRMDGKPLPIVVAFGVTTVRNPCGDPQANARYDRMVATGQWLGPEALPDTHFVTMESQYLSNPSQIRVTKLMSATASHSCLVLP